MPKKPKVKTKEEGERMNKPGGTKPIKVVTFDTPETEHPGQTESSRWGARAEGDVDKVVENQEPFSGSAAWGENAGAADGGGWDQRATGWTSPTPEPLPVPPPVPPDVRSPPPSSPPPPRPLSALPDTATATKESERRMSGSVAGETHDEYSSWGVNQATTTDQHRWESPLTNTATPLGLASPPVEPQSLAAAAAAVQMMKTNSASEAARKLARPTTIPQHSSAAPAPPPTSAQTRTAQPASSQQWGEWSKSTSTPQQPTRYGNREDYTIAAADIERQLRKAAAAAGHYNPNQGHATQNSGWGQQQSDHGWDSAKGSAWSRQGKGQGGGGWDQAAGSEAWGSHRGGSDAGWGGASRSKKSDRGWGHGSDAGYSQTSRSAHRGRQHQAQSSKHHKAKSWETWGRRHSEAEAESEDNEDENEGWEEEEGEWHDGGWGRSQQDQGWGGNGESSSWGKETSGWNKSGDAGWGTSGGNGGGDGGGWDQPQNGTEWGPSHHQNTWDESKVITDPPENVGTRAVLSPQQRSQILNSLLNLPQGQKSGGDLRRHGAGKKHKSDHSNGWSQQDGWGNDTGWGPIIEEEENSESEGGHPHASSKKPDVWNTSINDSSYTMPSKTLAYAYKDTTTSLHMGKPRNSMHDYTNVQFIESQGAALKPIHQALFGKARWAKDRIHWMFPPDKDERVSMLLAWIESMSYNLGTFGLHKFLQSRERGALITNADFRLPQLPNQPVFDWLTFDQLQGTMDKTMQESVVFYDPATQVIVFVLLPSKSGNSVAMWRRKIKVPNNTRLMYQEHIKQALAGLKKEKDHVVYVDRLPLKPENSSTPRPRSPAGGKLGPRVPSKITKAAPAPTPKKKRKWWQIFKSN